ncbi:hypothetical protein ACVIW2_004698 [Bradyrhizobium huanghuaihaiense]|uniref:Uncharacterized protein n=1 Tax=Bradyrhizobium huanghuaihaiense TaxID=990078 RepID=A0A562QWA8_9BRAD|nr:hypothetical protein IQ16_07259 [Bradyrhizobium huanghuaihaiense]
MIKSGAVFLMLILLGLSPGRAHAQDRPIGFLTPSKNIVCHLPEPTVRAIP